MANNYCVYHLRLPEEAHDLDAGYIGITNNFKRRKQEHTRGDYNRRTGICLSGYIADGAKFVILHDNLTLSEACKWEKKLRPEDNMGLNGAAGGNYALHANHAQVGKPIDDEVKKRISKTMSGMPKTKQHCKAISESLKGNLHSLGRTAPKGTPLQEAYRFANRWKDFIHKHPNLVLSPQEQKEIKTLRHRAYNMQAGRVIYRAVKCREMLDLADKWREKYGEPPYEEVAKPLEMDDLPF